MVYRDENGTEKSTKSLDAKLVRKVSRLERDARVSVVHGVHKGLGGTVLSVDDSTGYVQLTLHNDERVRVRKGDLVLGDVKPPERKKSSSRYYSDDDDDDDGRGGSAHKSSKHKKHDKKDKKKDKKRDKEERRESRTPMWLRSGLRVKVVSKSLHGGAYYNKKARWRMPSILMRPPLCRVFMHSRLGAPL